MNTQRVTCANGIPPFFGIKTKYRLAGPMTSTVCSVDIGLISCFVSSFDGRLFAIGSDEGVDVWAISGESVLLLVCATFSSSSNG